MRAIVVATAGGGMVEVTVNGMQKVLRVKIDPDTGRVTEIDFKSYHDPQSPEHETGSVKAKIFVLAANAVENARLYQRAQQEIVERKRAETAREQIIIELQDALAQVRTLTGLLPMCASCKKIRDDAGYWHQVEAYVQNHSEAQFSHGLCPDCIKKLYPEHSD